MFTILMHLTCRPLADAVSLVLNARLFPENTRNWNTLTRSYTSLKSTRKKMRKY